MTAQSLNFRRDNRSVEEFEEDIKNRTTKENFLMALFRDEATFRKWKIVGHLDNGIDNSGKIVEKSNCDADFTIVYESGKTKLVDIKNSPVNDKMTYKVYQLQQYVKQNASIILFYGTGKIDKDPFRINYQKTKFGIISPQKIQAMLDDNEHYKEPYFGYKVCVRVYKKDFDKYFKSYELLHRKEL